MTWVYLILSGLLLVIINWRAVVVLKENKEFSTLDQVLRAFSIIGLWLISNVTLIAVFCLSLTKL